jgi:hypothetical protein
MKIRLLLACSACVLALATPELYAAGKGPRRGGGGPGPAAQAVTKPDPTKPHEALQPYIVHIDQLLSLERPEGKPITPMLNQASGRITTLRQQFVAERKKGVEAAEQAKFDAAIATCDALTRALEERDKTMSQIESSSAVKGSKAIGARRKDNLTQGIDGGDRSKAVGAAVERDRERAERRGAAKRAEQGDNAMTAMSVNRWNERSLQLKKQITDSYGKINE